MWHLNAVLKEADNTYHEYDHYVCKAITQSNAAIRIAIESTDTGP